MNINDAERLEVFPQFEEYKFIIVSSTEMS